MGKKKTVKKRKKRADINYDCRIFLAYRTVGTKEGKRFSESYYNHILTEKDYREKYGEPYYSDKTSDRNYHGIIRRVMPHVRYCILALTPGFFNGFDSPDMVITREELREALRNKDLEFVPVSFQGFNMDDYEEILRRVFPGNDFDRLFYNKIIDYSNNNKKDVFEEIDRIVIRNDRRIDEMRDLYARAIKNVRMEFKKDNEDRKEYNIYNRLKGCRKITLLNYAASTLLASSNVAAIYEGQAELKDILDGDIQTGKIQVDFILTNPYSPAGKDAALFKMYPNGQKMPADEIILANLNNAMEFKKKNENCRVNIFLTNVALPYGILMSEHENKLNNHMKVDLYAAVTNTDDLRPSFFLMEQDRKVRDLYWFFQENMRNIKSYHSVKFDGHPDVSWLTGKTIAHRGMLHSDRGSHKRMLFEECIEKRYPMEIDLTILADGKVMAGRYDDALIDGVINAIKSQNEDDEKTGSDKEWTEKIRRTLTFGMIMDNLPEKEKGQVMLFDDFLELVWGSVPLLIEIKAEYFEKDDMLLHRGVKNIVDSLKEYRKRYLKFGDDGISQTEGLFAIHCARTYVLKWIRGMDCTIPLGQISRDFSRVTDDHEMIVYHQQMKYMEELCPEFISYSIADLPDVNVFASCQDAGIPLVGWAARKEEEYGKAKMYCDAVVAEGGLDYV